MVISFWTAISRVKYRMHGALLLLTICMGLQVAAQQLRKRTATLMGSKFEFTIVAEDSLKAELYIDTVITEISRIESLISEWKPDSEVSRINENAGIRPVNVSPEVFNLTRRAIQYAEITGGAFDISFAAMNSIWKFDGSMHSMPSKEAVKKSVEKVGYKNIILDSSELTIFLKKKGMKIGFGSIGKGYAADMGRALLRAKNVKAGIVNASGDMCVWGKQPNHKNWIIGLANPFKPGKIIKKIPLTDNAITTSGSYEHYFEIDGKRYSHIINPISGYPASGLSSVTVIGPSAEIANALSTSIIVLGTRRGLNLLEKFPAYQYYIIQDNGRIIQ